VVIIPLGLLLFVLQDNRGAARVNPVVSRAYEELRRETCVNVYTMCEYVTDSTTGSESWVCEVEPYQRDIDTCHVVVRRLSLWRVAVRITSCSLDQGQDGQVNADVERAYGAQSSRRGPENDMSRHGREHRRRRVMGMPRVVGASARGRPPCVTAQPHAYVRFCRAIERRARPLASPALTSSS